jgi:hypothetical protein
MKHFNGLSPAEAERLALFAEEMGEAIQVIGKVLRHGYESCHPKDVLRITNKGLLEKEVGHIQAALTLMDINGDLSSSHIEQSRGDKLGKVRQYLHHNLKGETHRKEEEG